MALAVGSQAPDFTLKTMTSDGLADRTLSSHKGKENVVLLFVPGAFTSVCTVEMQDMNRVVQENQGMNAVVYGISVDSPWSQDAWRKANNLHFELLSDYQHNTVREYDVELQDLAGLGPSSLRATYLIDKSGIVRYVEVTPKPSDSPNLAALKTAVEAL